MRHTILLAASVLAFVNAPAPARACNDHVEVVAPSPRKVTVAQLRQWQETKVAHTVVDVNGAATRKKHGVIPGAVLLSSASRFELRELPANRNEKLVFYCASTSCTAGETAAIRAMQAGFTDVNVLPVGITGWKAAGQKTDRVPRS